MKTTFVCIAALLIMVATVPAQAQTAITPFGNIAWEDSIGTVTQKMRALPGIESFVLSQGGNEVDLTQNSKDLTEAVKSLSRKALFRLKPKIHTDNRTGQTWNYLSGDGPSVSCYPVMIEGVPFKLTARFAYCAGALLYKPQNVLTNSAGELLPLILKEVTLTAKSPALAMKENAISAVLSQKYFGGKPVGGVTVITDPSGTSLTVNPGGSLYSIGYGGMGGSGYYQELNRLYEKYVTDLAVRSGQGKQNLSGGL
jgi:hypothetical protein